MNRVPDTLADAPHVWPAALRSRARAAAARAERYLRARQSANGGFCFYRSRDIDEPSLHDTWHAVATFALLGVEVPRHDAVVAFLRSFRTTGFDDLYHHALALDCLGRGDAVAAGAYAHIRQLDATEVLANGHIPVDARLEHALRIVTLQHRFAAIDACDTIVEATMALCHGGGWGTKPNLGDTWFALAILDRCGTHTFACDISAFVDALQIPSFGFTATGDSVHARLDTLHAGIRTCTLLGSPLRYAGDAMAFVLACQTDAGGFAPASDALANIGLTHRGVLALTAAKLLPVANVDAARADTGW